MWMVDELGGPITQKIEAPERPAALQRPDAAAEDFRSVLQQVRRLDDVQAHAENEAVRVAEGRGGNLHDAVLAMREAELSLQLAMSVRNKLVSAYEELMRMPV
ncbi:MAG: flagellar hook-basal body complex protein FliE [Acidobacteriota bacterium]